MTIELRGALVVVAAVTVLQVRRIGDDGDIPLFLGIGIEVIEEGLPDEGFVAEVLRAAGDTGTDLIAGDDVGVRVGLGIGFRPSRFARAGDRR